MMVGLILSRREMSMAKMLQLSVGNCEVAVFNMLKDLALVEKVELSTCVRWSYTQA
jgi:hypothetical protein